MLMDKMYIKLEQKDMPYKPQIYQRGRGQNQRQFSLGNKRRGYISVIEDMEEVEAIFREAIFGEVIFEADIIIEWREIGKIGEHGDNLGREKERKEVGHHLVLDHHQELVQIEIGSGVSNVESTTILQMNVLI